MPGGHIENAPGLASGSCVNEPAVLYGPCLGLFPSRVVWLQDLFDESGVDITLIANAYRRFR